MATAPGISKRACVSNPLRTSVQLPRRRTQAWVAARDKVIVPEKSLILPQYCESVYRAKRRPTRTVKIGNVNVGSEHPIALQTMTTTDTKDVEGTVAQVKRCADAGADLVRLTVQGRREAEACFKIRERLLQDKYETPLVADIHFQPKVAVMVAEAFQKIRVNPGNFADGTKKFDEINYEDPSQFEEERAKIERLFTPLVLKCKELGTAMRIGTNHGSLSARILSFYGDTPAGMVASAFEFAEICRKHDYHNFLFSMKASNPLVMVAAYRLLAEEQYNRGWDYPLHLGVTEAGEGEDGRMKSAIGIGSLLLDGLGDTIRVSLTEDPEYELDPCRQLADLGTKAVTEQWGIEEYGETTRDTHEFSRRVGTLPEQRDSDGDIDYRNVLNRDGSVLTCVTLSDLAQPEQLYQKLGCKLAVGMPFKDIASSDTLYMRELPAANDESGRTALRRLQEVGMHIIAPAAEIADNPMEHTIPLVPLVNAAKFSLPEACERFAVSIDGTESDEVIKSLQNLDPIAALLNTAPSQSRLHLSRRVFDILKANEIDTPVIHHREFWADTTRDEIVITTGSEIGGLLCDGLGDGILLDVPSEDVDYLRTTSFGLLQGSRMRNVKTEYVSCPSCGRTLFDLQEVTAQISEQTGHLPGVTIAVMGCIVNGPGEMADADFGYVGGAPGKIDLYVGKEVVRRAIPMESACDELIELIKEHDRWVDKDEDVQEELVSA
uniref:4-hydroxy-3-methylbut-2-en-1-yl diphosphate synthase (ferredoxin), chloroplastic n=1 Tax=Ulva prolifera TaxID=3117 RepID=A0A482JNM8_ULVPR|nr:plastid 4-hydroxy-3-methylbut-2-en-1-yl diphosphate synthase precursor [Ulva prolifera]